MYMGRKGFGFVVRQNVIFCIWVRGVVVTSRFLVVMKLNWVVCGIY